MKIGKILSLAALLGVLGFATARTAIAQTFPVTFDTTALDAATFNVDFNAIGGTHFPNTVTTLQVPPRKPHLLRPGVAGLLPVLGPQ